jgi:hypothetical protein
MRKRYYELTTAIKPGFSLARTVTHVKHDNSNIENVADDFPEDINGVTSEEFADAARWRVPPHVALANLTQVNYPKLTHRQRVVEFIKTYGVLGTKFSLVFEPGATFNMSMTMFTFLQQALQRAWQRPTAENLHYLWISGHWNERERKHFRIPLAFTPQQRLELLPADLWTYIRLLFIRDSSEHLARICANKNCKHPYFIANRKDKHLCSPACRNAANQRNFQRNKKQKRAKQRMEAK